MHHFSLGLFHAALTPRLIAYAQFTLRFYTVWADCCLISLWLSAMRGPTSKDMFLLLGFDKVVVPRINVRHTEGAPKLTPRQQYGSGWRQVYALRDTTALGLAACFYWVIPMKLEAKLDLLAEQRTSRFPAKRRQSVYKGRASVEFCPIAVFPKPRSRLD